MTSPLFIPTNSTVLGSTAWVVASNASKPSKAAARVAKARYRDLIQICDGVDDDIEIQAAIDAVKASSAGVGNVLCSEGTLNTTSELNVTDSGVSLVGRGSEATLIQGSGIANLLSATSVSHICVANMELDAGFASSSRGLNLDGVTYSLFYDIKIDRCFTQIYMSGDSRNCGLNTFFQCGKDGTGVAGVFMDGGTTNNVTWNRFYSCEFRSAASVAATAVEFARRADTNHFYSCRVFLNHADDIGFLYNSHDPNEEVGVYQNHLIFCTVEKSTSLGAGTTTSIDGNRTDAGKPSIVLGLTTNANDMLPDLQADSEIRLVQSAFGGVSSLTENWGNDTGVTPDANGNDTIAHGLISAPSYASAHLGGDNVNGVDVESVDATNITIRVKDASGADVTTGTFTVYWEARI